MPILLLSQREGKEMNFNEEAGAFLKRVDDKDALMRKMARALSNLSGLCPQRDGSHWAAYRSALAYAEKQVEEAKRRGILS